METAKASEVTFMDVFSNPMFFSNLYSYLEKKEKATLRLVSKELRDAVNLNVRSIAAELGDDDSESILYFSAFVSKLPNLESIDADVPFSSSGLINVWRAAQLASNLTKLKLRDPEDRLHGRSIPTLEERAELLDNSVGTINHHHWPLLQSLRLPGLNTTVSTDAMKGLLRLSTLTHLCLNRCTLKNESLNPIQPGSWPCLRRLYCDECRLEDPAVAIKALLHLTGLERFSLISAGITGRALARIQPGSWLKLQVLDLEENTLSDDPVGAMKGLLCLTSLSELNTRDCRLNGQAISQIKPDDWPCLQIFDADDRNDFSDDPVGAMSGLLHLTSLQELNVAGCRLTGEAISQIKPGDWPHLQQLKSSSNDFSDDPVGAMKGLLCLTSLSELSLRGCGLSGEASSQIKPGDWPHLQKFDAYFSDLSDDPVGAMKGLLCLTALSELGLIRCRLSGEAISQIKPGDWSELHWIWMSGNDLSDDPVGAMKGLLRLASLQHLNGDCSLTGEAVSQIKPGDWPHLQQLGLSCNDFSDDPVGARKGLLHLTSLTELDIENCGWTEEEMKEIHRALGPE